MSRYWRIAGIQSPSNALAVSYFALYDGVTDYTTATLTGALSSGFKINWDLGSDIAVTAVKLTSITRPDFPTALLLEYSADSITWTAYRAVEIINYPGDATATTLTLADVNFHEVALHLKADGTNGSTALLDTSIRTKVMTAAGNAQISTAQSKFGGSSISLDGTGDYFSTPDSGDFEFGSGAFTMRCWVRLTGYADVGGDYYAGIIAKDLNGARSWNLGLRGTVSSYTTLEFQGSSSGGSTNVQGSFAFSLNTWYHIEVVRSENLVYLFVDGTLLNAGGTAFSQNIRDTTTPVYIGAIPFDGTNFYYLTGYVDDIQVLKGVGLHTANFTPPSAALPDYMWSGTTKPTTAVAGTGSTSGVTTSPDGGTYPSAGPVGSISGVSTADTLDGGAYKIVGTVAEKSTPTNVPVARRVLLLEDHSHRVIRETWSDDAGDYEFLNVKGDAKYTAVAYDHRNAYRAVVADNLTPELMT